MQHDAAINVNSMNKPEIILHYNKTKIGSRQPRPPGWTVQLQTQNSKMANDALLQYSGLCVRGSVCYLDFTESGVDNTHKRRLFMRGPSKELVEDHLQRHLGNPQAMQAQGKVAFKALGFQPPVPAVAEQSTEIGRASCRERV